MSVSVSAAKAGARWVEIAGDLISRLPGEWQLTGRGQKARLVQTPVGWTAASLGFTQTSYGEARLFATRNALLKPFDGWTVYPGVASFDTPLRTPKFVITEPGDDERVHRFVFDYGLPALDRYSEEWMASRHEALAPPVTLVSVPDWQLAPGWSVVTGTGSPVPSATAYAEFWASRDPHHPHLPFYRDLVTAWEGGGRPAAMEYLLAHRRAVMTAQKLPGADRPPAPWT